MKRGDQLKDLIQLTYDIIFEQWFLNVSSHVYHNRTYTLQNTSPHFNRTPLLVKYESDLHTLFQPLITLLDLMTNQRKENDDRAPIRMNTVSSSDNTLAGQITQTGSKIKVHWSREEIGDTGWKSGWYVTTVHKYCEETDMLTILCVRTKSNP